MTNLIRPTRNPDVRLLLLGIEFDHAFERYLRCIDDVNEVADDCRARLDTFGVPSGDDRWNRLFENACAPWLEAAREAGAAVETISRQIAAVPATTVPGLLVKAKTLPFDVVERDDDARSETLHAFIDQVEAVAYGPMAC